MADSTVTGNQGKRYSVEQKTEIFKFIEAFNAENKRGGMKAASEKYGVSVVTLSNWSKANRTPKKKKIQAKAKTTTVRKNTKVAKAVTATAGDKPGAILKRLQAILEETAALEAEYNSLKKLL